MAGLELILTTNTRLLLRIEGPIWAPQNEESHHVGFMFGASDFSKLPCVHTRTRILQFIGFGSTRSGKINIISSSSPNPWGG